MWEYARPAASGNARCTFSLPKAAAYPNQWHASGSLIEPKIQSSPAGGTSIHALLNKSALKGHTHAPFCLGPRFPSTLLPCLTSKVSLVSPDSSLDNSINWIINIMFSSWFVVNVAAVVRSHTNHPVILHYLLFTFYIIYNRPGLFMQARAFLSRD